MALNFHESSAGTMVFTDYLIPYRQACVHCGPLCMTTATINTLSATTIDVTGSLTIGGSPIVISPTQNWLPIGPVAGDGINPIVIPIIVGPGTWQLEVSLVGTHSITEFAHYMLVASFSDNGITGAVIAQTLTRSVLSPSMNGTTTFLLVSGTPRAYLEITATVIANWNGYMRLVGSPVV